MRPKERRRTDRPDDGHTSSGFNTLFIKTYASFIKVVSTEKSAYISGQSGSKVRLDTSLEKL